MAYVGGRVARTPQHIHNPHAPVIQPVFASSDLGLPDTTERPTLMAALAMTRTAKASTRPSRIRVTVAPMAGMDALTVSAAMLLRSAARRT